MEIEQLISVLEETVSYLSHSRTSDWSSISLEEVIQSLESEVAKLKNSQPFDAKLLDFLFAPTGAIQETSIDNGWGEDFLRLSAIVDQFTGKSN